MNSRVPAALSLLLLSVPFSCSKGTADEDQRSGIVTPAASTSYVDLLLDDRYIESMSSLQPSILSPQKYAGNPVYPAAGPNPFTWDFLQAYGTMWRSPGSRFDYFYNSLDNAGSASTGTSLATS